LRTGALRGPSHVLRSATRFAKLTFVREVGNAHE
jgi:hypothetical protein